MTPGPGPVRGPVTSQGRQELNPTIYIGVPSKRDKITTRLRSLLRNFVNLGQRLDELRLLHGCTLAELQRSRGSHRLQDYELRVFSQWGEDGILQRLTSLIEIPNKTFIEFGVEDFTEANCRFLMMKDNWSGFVIDGSERSMRRLRAAYDNWRYDLSAACAFITRENINELLALSGFDHDLGVLSVDIDGVDYHVLQAITGYRPRILIVEYNAVFGGERAITVPYQADFFRTAAHHSNLYFGASLAAFRQLCGRMGYTFVGSTSAGVNAFFVRNDVVTPAVAALATTAGYTPSKVRESKGPDGRPTLLSGAARLGQIRGLPVINVLTGETETL